MKPHFSLSKIVLVLLLTVTVIGFSAFGQEKESEDYSNRKEDSTAARKRNKIEVSGDFDRLDLAMRQLELQMKDLDEQMKHLDITINGKRLNALKEIHTEKISRQLNESIKSIDWEKINNDLKNNLASVNKVEMHKIQAEMQKVKAELQKQKFDLDLNDLKIDTKRIKENVDRAMKGAKDELLKAKDEIKNLQDFTSQLQKDGLIDKSKGYRLEVKDGELYIDGKKQPKEVSDRYRKYYRKSNFTLDMNENDSFSI